MGDANGLIIVATVTSNTSLVDRRITSCFEFGISTLVVGSSKP